MNIILTGAGSGIGFETSKLLSKNHQVIAIARSADKVKHLESIGCIPYLLDINEENHAPFLQFIKEKIGSVDILINNAATLINKPFEALTISDWQSCYQTNVIAPALFIQALLPLFTDGAHIVNIGSMGGYQGSEKFAGLSAYSASKAALHNLTESLAVELAPRNIKVNALALGAVQTDMLAKAFPEYQAKVSAAEMAQYISHFALTGHLLFNGKIIPVALSTP